MLIGFQQLMELSQCIKGRLKQPINYLLNLSKGLNVFLFDMISVDHEGSEKVAFNIEAAKNIFGTLENIEDFLSKQDESRWKYLTEFKQLFQKTKEEGFTRYVEFNFSAIPDKRSKW